MDIKQYLQNPCEKLSIPYWKDKVITFPDSIRIIHHRDWNGQYRNYQRFFRIFHDLKSYRHENIVVTEKEILKWKQRETFREDLCVCINAEDGKMVASGIAEFDETCREGIIEWVQVLPEYRERGLGKKIVDVLLWRLKGIGADFVTVSGNLDNTSSPLELYRKCGFTGDDIWYICRV